MSTIASDAASSAVRYNVGEHETRPWGRWEVLGTGTGYTLKRIEVNPGQRLSLQFHHHRDEHWTIVEGHGEVQVGEELLAVSTGAHVFIPVGALHRIQNTGDTVLVFIEVQVGDLLDESDIVRVIDDYGRQPLQPANR